MTFLLWLLSGILFGVSFVIPALWWCFLPGFVLFLYGIRHERSLYKIFFYGWLVGSLQYGGAFFWVWSAYPILWMQDQSMLLQLSAIGYYFALTSIAVGLGSGICAIAIKRLGNDPVRMIGFVPLIWVLSEVLKSLLFSIYAMGDGGFIYAGFSYGYIGYLLAENPLTLKIAAIAGVYGMSYAAALAAAILFVALIQRRSLKSRRALFVAVTLCVSACALYIYEPVYESRHTVVISLEAHFDREYLAQEDATQKKNTEILQALELALIEDPDVIVAPEDVRFSAAFGSQEEFFAFVRSHTDSKKMVIIDTGPAMDARGKQVIRSYMYDLATDSVYFIDKKYLVPQGEFMSFVHDIALKLLMSKEQLNEVAHTARFKAGVMNDSSAFPAQLPGVLFCFETMVPYAVKRALSYRDPAFVVHPISHAWFVDPYSLEYELQSMVRVHSVWNDVPIVTSGSMTKSRLYLPTGEIQDGTVIAEEAYWKLKKFSF